MPITLVIERDRPPVLTFEDPYTIEQWIAAMESLLAAGPLSRVLIDRRSAAPPTRDFVERMVGFLGAHAQEVKGSRAAVVTSTDANFGVARMMELMTQARQIPTVIQGFRTWEDAQRWLLS